MTVGAADFDVTITPTYPGMPYYEAVPHDRLPGRAQPGIPHNRATAAAVYEHSMGPLPPHILRRSATCAV
jgi:hypothetical protein